MNEIIADSFSRLKRDCSINRHRCLLADAALGKVNSLSRSLSCSFSRFVCVSDWPPVEVR